MDTNSMRAMRDAGASYRTIAEKAGVNHMTVYKRLHGLSRPRRAVAANDDKPDRFTAYAAYNGGCSTLSGMAPVTLAKRVAA